MSVPYFLMASFSNVAIKAKTTFAKQIGNLSIREILVVTSAYVRPLVRTDPGGGKG